MATGIMIAVAAPTLLAGVAAFGAYRFAKWYANSRKPESNAESELSLRGADARSRNECND
jgi:hypothetical protein